ncbi:MAG: hypothetical protein ACKOBP_09465, partial [Planctomycetia bacterium]
MDGESEADTQRAEAWRAEANVRREGLGSHEPARKGSDRLKPVLRAGFADDVGERLDGTHDLVFRVLR